jgi:DNA-binding transcriptional regulator YhcF (GntR family)
MNSNLLGLSKNISKRKYIVDSIIEEIQNGKIGIGSALPSLNELSEQFGVSYKSAVNAYRDLKSRGIIKSSPRKGFYVSSLNIDTKHRIFLFLNEFNSFKDVLYNSIREGIGKKGTVDVYFHNFNPKVYQQIIRENLGLYTAYVIMPMHEKNCDKALESIPEGKLYILDIGLFPYGKKYPSVCQNFENDLYSTLVSARDLLAKYNKIILVIPHFPFFKVEYYIDGLNRFCHEHNFESEHILNAVDRRVAKGECYVIMLDIDLDRILNETDEAGFMPGEDVGIISYHETPLKSRVANGISTISTDFRLMGHTMAEMILKRKKEHIENPCHLIRRGSL